MVTKKEKSSWNVPFISSYLLKIYNDDYLFWLISTYRERKEKIMLRQFEMGKILFLIKKNNIRIFET